MRDITNLHYSEEFWGGIISKRMGKEKAPAQTCTGRGLDRKQLSAL